MSNAFLAHLGRAYVGLILFFLYAPILVMAAMSFNASEFYQLPFSFTTDWYAKLAGNREILSAAWRSVWIAVIVTAIATSLGTAASIALFRYDFPGKRVLQVLLFPPIAIPWLITGTAMLIFFFGIGLGRGTPAVILGHVALALPYVIVVVSARLTSFDRTLEEAARSLGASPWQITRAVTVPWILPGIIAGGLFAFAVSFDQFVVSYFLSEPGDSTLPVLIYTSIRKGFTPEINAISTIIIAVSMGIMLLAARYSNFGGER
ncbi:spermidine/putrescine transport system permease protein [Defluviimonas denitrificans]|jgi:spermidine/putrescine transport system permease protein|uniref:Spermidine/putrescine transport system permease protein n=1 Tax=Albidovulum denitrificans TaxID=404881 RepID=A0A2S8S5D4_9RHOB|nr:ABC transporter permease [Defluviimonas denitrificans]PQV56006.1 spermidine/putrescine transport system permease protein [Defluviimonas denitrificans]